MLRQNGPVGKKQSNQLELYNGLYTGQRMLLLLL